MAKNGVTTRGDAPAAQAQRKSVCVTVLGAGRSGTSAITRGLAAIGVDLGDNLRRGRGKNPTGFWEDRDLLALNKRLKRALGIRGDSVRLIEDEEWEQPSVRALHDEAVQTIRRRFGGHPLWGYKYGRTLRMLPFWLGVYEAAGLDVRYVIALRNPISVARSRERLDAKRGAQEKSDLEWLVNVVPYFHQIRGSRFVVVDYDRVMASPASELARMASRLGIELTNRDGVDAYAREFLRPGMRHSRFTIADLESNPRVHWLVREAYSWLDRLAGDEIGTDDARFWHAWERVREELVRLKPVLTHIDRVQADLLAARRSLLGPLQAVPELWRRLQAR